MKSLFLFNRHVCLSGGITWWGGLKSLSLGFRWTWDKKFSYRIKQIDIIYQSR